MEKEPKFPANSYRIAGSVYKVETSADQSRINLTILTPSEGNRDGQFLKAMIPGEDRVKNFLQHYDEVKKDLPEHSQVQLSLQGIASFTKYSGNDNCTLIVQDKLNGPSENFIIPKTEKELEEFKARFHPRSEEINQVKITGRLGEEPKFVTPNQGTEKEGKEFASLSFAHNYSVGKDDQEKETKVMWANIVVPNSQVQGFKDSEFSKGTTVKVTAQVQPKVYENKNGEKVFTFNLISRSVVPDLSKLIESDKPVDVQKDKAADKEVSTDKPNKKEKSAAADKSVPKEKKSNQM